MSTELRDLRAKITVESDAALDVVSRVTGRDRSELVRDIVHRWADKVLHESTLVLRLAPRDGKSRSAAE